MCGPLWFLIRLYSLVISVRGLLRKLKDEKLNVFKPFSIVVAARSLIVYTIRIDERLRTVSGL